MFATGDATRSLGICNARLAPSLAKRHAAWWLMWPAMFARDDARRARETKVGMCFAVFSRPRMWLHGSVGYERGEYAELAGPGSIPGTGSGKRVSLYVATEQAKMAD